MNQLTSATTTVKFMLAGPWMEYWKCYLPIMAVSIPRNLNAFVSIYFVGHFNNDAVITGFGIGQITMFCILNSSIMGFGSLFECYAGAIKSSEDPNKLGELLVKCFLQGGLVFLIIVGPYLNVVHVISFLGEDKTTHVVATKFIRMSFFYPMCIHMQELLIKYLVIQGYVRTPIVVGICMLVVNALLLYLNVVLNWGVTGIIGISYIGTPVITVIGNILFCFRYKKYMLWSGITPDIWKGWGEMMKLGTLNGFRLLSVYAVYVLSNIICQVGGPITATTTIVVDKINLLFNVFVYSGASATAFILGNALGTRSVSCVKKAMLIGVVNVAIERAVSIVIMFVSAEVIARLFTDTDVVLRGVTRAKPVMALSYLLFGFDELLAQGILTPFGKQAVIGIAAPLSVFLIGFPMMFYIVYCTSTGAIGIFWCFVACHIVQCMVYGTRLAFINLDQEINLSGDRVDRGFHHSREDTLYARIDNNIVYDNCAEEDILTDIVDEDGFSKYETSSTSYKIKTKGLILLLISFISATTALSFI